MSSRVNCSSAHWKQWLNVEICMQLVLSLRAGSFGQDSSHTMQSSLNHGSNHASALRSLPSVGLEKSSTINLNEKMTRSKSDDEEISLSDLEGGNLAE